MEDVGDLRGIGGNAYFEGSKIKSLKNITSIGKDAWFIHCDLEDTGKLVSIGGRARFWGSQIEDLANIKYIGGDVSFVDSKVKAADRLECIEGDVFYNPYWNAEIIEVIENRRIARGGLCLV